MVTLEFPGRHRLRATLGSEDKLCTIRRLDEQARLLDRSVAGPTLVQFIE